MDNLNQSSRIPLRLSIGGHGGNVYGDAGALREDIIDFSANINPLGVPSQIKKALRDNFDRILHYPDPHAERMTGAIAQYWNIKKENILAGNGSVEFIYLVMQALAPATVCIPAPSFSDYERAARIVRSRVLHVPLQWKNGFMLDVSKIPESDVLIFGNPNNPTGNLLVKKSKTVENLPGRMVVVDEAFMDFLENERDFSLIREATRSKRIIVLRTFTKFFAMPGLRSGYMIAHKDIIDHVKQFRIPWTCNAFAQIAAEMVLQERSYIEKTRALIKKEREFLCERIGRIESLTPFPSEANYLLVRIMGKGMTSSQLAVKFSRQGILIRDCANYKGLSSRFFRIAIRTHRENIILIKAMNKLLG